MKKASIFFAGLFILTASQVFACPNLAGTYTAASTSGNTTGTVTIVTTQSACDSINFLVTFTASNGAVTSLNYNVPTDGVLHKVQSNGTVDEYMQMQYQDTKLLSMAVWVQNGVPTPAVSSSSDVFSLDETNNLVDYSVQVNHSTGTMASSSVTYKRVGGGAPSMP